MSDQPTDPNLTIAAILKLGVAISFVLLLTGLVWTIVLIVAGGKAPPPQARNLTTGALHPNVLLIEAGLLALMATPVMRVVAAGWLFHRAGETRYAWISIVVLSIVLGSILLSLLK